MGKLLGFLEDRLGLVTFWRSSMIDKRPPRGIGWLRTLGFCALTIAVLQFLSGIALALHYVPSADLAYDSILALQKDVPLGTFTRALHHFGASAFVVVAVLHVARVFFTGAYKRPRELTWLTGVGLLLVVLGFGFTGYLLPWDQKAYFATKVGTQIAGQAPLVGDFVRQTLNGGDAVGPPTLTRFYVIHIVLLPLALLGLLGLHLFLIQRHGVAAPGRPVGDEGEKGAPYFPDHVFKEAVAGVAVAAILCVLAASFRAPLEALAEPSDTGYDPRPDWYFLGLFQMLKLFKGSLSTLGTFWLPNVLLLGMVLLPFVDRNPERSWRRRPLVVGGGVFVALSALALTVMGAMDSTHNAPILRHRLGLTDTQRQGYLLLRQLECMRCHAYVQSDGSLLGGSAKYEDAPRLGELAYEFADFDATLEAPKEVLDEDTPMPSFSYVPVAERRALFEFLKTLAK